MTRAKGTISVGIVIIVVISIWMSFSSSPISGIAVFFILTGLLWALAKTRHWI